MLSMNEKLSFIIAVIVVIAIIMMVLVILVVWLRFLNRFMYRLGERSRAGLKNYFMKEEKKEYGNSKNNMDNSKK